MPEAQSSAVCRIDVPDVTNLVANPLLADVFRELDRAGVGHCVLRGADELTSLHSFQEVDLLVAPEDLEIFVHTVRRSGFEPWPAWGHEPHRFFVTYDAQNDSWLKLDVVSELRYGRPFRNLRLDLATDCLHGRERWGPTWIPRADDELLTTALHCVLDKSGVRDAHRERLVALWQRVRANVRLRMRLERKAKRHVGTDCVPALAAAAEDGAWDALVALAPRWSRRLLWRSPVLGTSRALRSRVLRRARRLLLCLKGYGTSTVLLAPDGGGKSTLSAALARDPFLRARVVYMGGNAEAGALRLPGSRWLDAKLAPGPGGRGPMRFLRWPGRSALRALRTVLHLLEDWTRHAVGQHHKRNGRFVVYDRYFYDTYLSPRAGSRRVRARRWLLERTTAPPDRVLLLDAPGDLLYARKREHSPEVLEAQRQKLLSLAERIPNFTVVDATRGADAARRRAIWIMWNDITRRRLQSAKPAAPRPDSGGLTLNEMA